MWTCIASLTLTGLFFLADAYLLIFHIYLIYNDLSTYKYIRNAHSNKKSKVIKEVDRGQNMSNSEIEPSPKKKSNVQLVDVILCGACAPRPVDYSNRGDSSNIVPEK